MDQRVRRALLVLVAAFIPARPAEAGGPDPAGRSFGISSMLAARLTLTVTDHGATCGEGANSTATWVVRPLDGSSDQVVCARNDTASQVQFPECTGNSNVDNPLRCSTNFGGIQGLNETTLVGVESGLNRWLAYKLYPTQIAQTFTGSAASTTVLTDQCQKATRDGTAVGCASDTDCDLGLCDLGTGTCASFPSPSCTQDTDCQLGPCVFEAPKLLGCAADPNKACSSDADCNFGTCVGQVCSLDAAVACGSDADCKRGCLGPNNAAVTTKGSRAVYSLVLGFAQGVTDQGTCVANICSNDSTVACTGNADCNLVINLGNAPVMTGAACTHIQCGDGIVDPDEQCDDGTLNGTGPSACTCDCTFVTTTTTSTSTSTSTTTTIATTTTTTTIATTTTTTTIATTTTTIATTTTTTTPTTTTTTAAPTTTTTTTAVTSTSSTSTSTAPPTTTSTSTTTAPPTTTTTLPPSCPVAATFESIDCRLDALIALVTGANDVGRAGTLLLIELGNAKKRTDQAHTFFAGGNASRGRTALRRAIRWMIALVSRVGSLTGRRQIGPITRQMIAEQGKALIRDMQSLLRDQTS